MCGFVGAFNITSNSGDMRERVIQMSKKLDIADPIGQGYSQVIIVF